MRDPECCRDCKHRRGRGTAVIQRKYRSSEVNKTIAIATIDRNAPRLFMTKLMFSQKPILIRSVISDGLTNIYKWWVSLNIIQQGKSEGFESCDWPIVRKRPIWVKIGDVLYRVTLKFDGWPWKMIGHLSFAVSSFVQHFIAIGEFKLELQSGNAHFGSNSTIFRAVWPWNLTDDLEK